MLIILFCFRSRRTLRLSRRAVMPGKPVEYGQGEQGDQVCYHANRPFIWPASPDTPATLNRFVSFISVLLKASQSLLRRKTVAFFHEAAWFRIDCGSIIPVADLGIP